MAVGVAATDALVQDLEAKIAAAQNYIAQQERKGNERTVAGATEKLNEYLQNLATVVSLEPGYSDTYEMPTSSRASGGSGAPAATPQPEETGNTAVDTANLLSNILNSPLYTEEIKSAYLTEYLPGLTQATYEINRARSEEVRNAALRQQAQAQAIREIAGSYAARGMRTPKMVTEGFAPVQQSTEMQRQAAEADINQLISNKEVLYGAGAQDAETFMSDPVKFGSVGAAARRTALNTLTSLPQFYGLTQVEGSSSAPGGATGSSLAGDNYRPSGPVMAQQPDGTWGWERSTGGFTGQELKAKITAAEKYIAGQQAKGNQNTVAGATKKLEDYRSQLAGLAGRY